MAVSADAEYHDVLAAEVVLDIVKLRTLVRTNMVPRTLRADVWRYLLGVRTTDVSHDMSADRERRAEYAALRWLSSVDSLHPLALELTRYFRLRALAAKGPFSTTAVDTRQHYPLMNMSDSAFDRSSPLNHRFRRSSTSIVSLLSPIDVHSGFSKSMRGIPTNSDCNHINSNRHTTIMDCNHHTSTSRPTSTTPLAQKSLNSKLFSSVTSDSWSSSIISPTALTITLPIIDYSNHINSNTSTNSTITTATTPNSLIYDDDDLRHLYDSILSTYLSASRCLSWTHNHLALQPLVYLIAPFTAILSDECDIYFAFERLLFYLASELLDQTALNTRVINFSQLFRSIIPDLFEYFEEEEVNISELAMDWMQHLLAKQLPIRCTLRLWEVYFTMLSGQAGDYYVDNSSNDHYNDDQLNEELNTRLNIDSDNDFNILDRDRKSSSINGIGNIHSISEEDLIEDSHHRLPYVADLGLFESNDNIGNSIPSTKIYISSPSVTNQPNVNTTTTQQQRQQQLPKKGPILERLEINRRCSFNSTIDTHPSQKCLNTTTTTLSMSPPDLAHGATPTVKLIPVVRKMLKPIKTSSRTETGFVDFHAYVCLAVLLHLKETLEELERSEIRTLLLRLPDMDIDHIVTLAGNLQHEFIQKRMYDETAFAEMSSSHGRRQH